MNISQEAALAKHIKMGNLHGCYLLYGQERYLVSAYTQKMIEQAVEPSMQTFNLHRFSEKSNFDEVLQAVEALPVFAPIQCIVVNDFALDLLSSKQLEQLKILLGDLAPTTLLIFSYTSVIPDFRKNSKWKNFKSWVDHNGIVATVDKRDAAQLSQYLQTRAKQQGKILPPAIASQMIVRCSDDMLMLTNELDKVCSYADGETITANEMMEVTSQVVESSVFDIAKALLRRDLQSALKTLHKLFYLREQPINILAALSSSFCDLYRVGVCVRDGVDPSALSQVYSYKGKEFRIRNAQRDLSKFSLEFAKKCIELLAKADLLLKSSKADAQTVLEQTMTEMMMISQKSR